MLKVLILGATSPIARALAARFARDGSQLCLAARNLREADRIAADLHVRTGASAMAAHFDALDFDSHPGFIRSEIERMGGLDGVVLCFGTLGDESAARSDPAEALAVVNLNFTAAVSILTICATHLEARRHGFMIVVGSVAGDRGRNRNYPYGSAKGALALFTQGLRGRLARSPVSVLTVKPGFIDTRMTWGRDGTFMVASPERAAARIYSAWRRRKEVVYVPGFWRPIMAVIKIIPERIFKRLPI